MVGGFLHPLEWGSAGLGPAHAIPAVLTAHPVGLLSLHGSARGLDSLLDHKAGGGAEHALLLLGRGSRAAQPVAPRQTRVRGVVARHAGREAHDARRGGGPVAVPVLLQVLPVLLPDVPGQMVGRDELGAAHEDLPVGRVVLLQPAGTPGADLLLAVLVEGRAPVRAAHALALVVGVVVPAGGAGPLLVAHGGDGGPGGGEAGNPSGGRVGHGRG